MLFMEAFLMCLGNIPIVSLDKIYLSNEDAIFLDCTRLDKSEDLISRINPSDINNVDNQIKIISDKLKEIKQNQIVLADDVVFSGSVLRTITNKFKNNQIEVIGVRTPVSTNEAYDYFNSKMPLGLRCVYLMGKDFIDQICERDFYFGIAQSGISVKNSDGEIFKAPYFKPYGNPIERASIPSQYERYFSIRCIERSLDLWLEIEKLSNREIFMRSLPEKINLTENNQRVVEVLENSVKKEIEEREAFIDRNERVYAEIDSMFGACVLEMEKGTIPTISVEKLYSSFGFKYPREDQIELVKILKKGRK